MEICVDGRCQPAKLYVWPLRVVINPPVFDDLSYFGEIAEDVFVKAFIPQSANEAFSKSVLHELFWCDVMPANSGVLAPSENRVRDHFRAHPRRTQSKLSNIIPLVRVYNWLLAGSVTVMTLVGFHSLFQYERRPFPTYNRSAGDESIR